MKITQSTITLETILDEHRTAHKALTKQQLLERCANYYEIPATKTKGLNKAKLVEVIVAHYKQAMYEPAPQPEPQSQPLTLKELKELAKQLGVVPTGDKRLKSTWVDALATAI